MPTEQAPEAALAAAIAEVERLRAENEHLLEAQRELEENRTRLSEIFDNAPVAWLTLDASGSIQNLNLVAVTLMGFGRRQLVGAPLSTLVHPDDRRRLRDHLLACRTSRNVGSCELRLASREGDPIPVRLATRRAQSDAESYVLSLVDLREREAAAAEQQRLRNAEREARAANDAKDQFIAMLSHELRTPLTPVLAAASALVEVPELPEEVRDTLAIVQRNVVTEVQLIDDLLDLARITHGKMRIELRPVDTHLAVRDAIDTLKAEAERKKLTLAADLTAQHYWVNGDPTRLQQVFWNLLRNAIKFTELGGQIEVRSWNSHGRLQLEVSDNGRGIDQAVLARLFRPFEQALSEDAARSGGLGLGLPICRGILEQHDGTIVASSQGPGTGARFIVELGTIDPPTLPPPEEPISTAPPPPEKVVRILLVEDHEDTAEIFERMLRRGGYIVKTASSLRSALAVERSEFDVLLSDVGLADGSGLDLMRTLRKGGKVKGIALSGYGTEEDVKASKEAGFSAHMTKPVNFGALLDAIATLHVG